MLGLVCLAPRGCYVHAGTVRELHQELRHHMTVVLHPASAAPSSAAAGPALQCDSLMPEHCCSQKGPVHLSVQWLYDSAARCEIQAHSDMYQVACS